MMAAARIRRTFRYPDDSEFKYLDREELDEEGLVSLIFLPRFHAEVLRAGAPYKTPAIGE